MITATPTKFENKYYALATLKSAMQHIDMAKNDLRHIGIDISTIDDSRLRIEAMISDVEFSVVV